MHIPAREGESDEYVSAIGRSVVDKREVREVGKMCLDYLHPRTSGWHLECEGQEAAIAAEGDTIAIASERLEEVEHSELVN